ncbi:MAG: hypothetical protein JO113_01460 [Candidatus Eremiobacteraeota bacterium]|nr:hypothetical protein [Candidatus Eremiobacteraeota bacterium]
MNSRRLLNCAGAVVMLAVVSACGTGSTVAPSVAPFEAHYVGKTLFLNGRPITAARLNPLPRYTQLVPDTQQAQYEYVLNYYGSFASMFDYPKSAAMIRELPGAGGQGCTNVLYGYGKNIIWNPGRTNDLITNYQVPGNLVLKTLYLGYTYTSSCAMNAAGDLAVGVLLGNSFGNGGQVVIFKNASGPGKVYNTPLIKEYFNGYDSKGNLFADGFITPSSWARRASEGQEHLRYHQNEQLSGISRLGAVGRQVPHRIRSGVESADVSVHG